jgi:hypothetical protein
MLAAMASAADVALQRLLGKLEADGDCAGLVALMQQHGSSEDVQVCACRALARLCRQATAAAAAVNAGAIEVVVAALRAHIAVADVQKSACCALSELVDDEGGNTNLLQT